MMVYDDNGQFTGRAMTLLDIAPPVRLAPSSWSVWLGYAATRTTSPIELNDYSRVVLAGRRSAEPLVHESLLAGY
jgi:hypothetical protein